MKHIPLIAIFLCAINGNINASEAESDSGFKTEIELSTCYARFVAERDDDFAWENDKVAFRAYGPFLRNKGVKNGIDCWLKRVDYPIINKWYDGHFKGISYHEDHGEGYDPYHVGPSLGCGGLGLWVNGELVQAETFSEWKIIHIDDDEVRFVLIYEWQYSGDQYLEKKFISLEKGSQLFDVESRFYKNGVIARQLPVAVGITTHDGKATANKNVEQGWISCWESIDGFGLGTGVVIDPKRIKSCETIESTIPDESHLLIIAQTDNNGTVEYSAGYGWGKAGEIQTEEEWIEYLSNQ